MTSVLEWRTCRSLAWFSLIISFIEIIVVWATATYLYANGPNTSVYRVTEAAWVLGTPLSIIASVVAVLNQRHRRIGMIALIVAIISFLVCGLPMIT
ncbi:MAG TPA: hypothetical protein VJV22_18785 [Acidobacteriaceae bacterium]|nr:hypothetical protein [Acidobacteriaceae bacterium]